MKVLWQVIQVNHLTPRGVCGGGQDWKPLGAACRDTSALAHISMRKHRLMLQEFVILRKKKKTEIQFLNRKSDFKNMLEIIFFNFFF